MRERGIIRMAAPLALVVVALTGCATVDESQANQLAGLFAPAVSETGIAPNMTPELAADLYGDTGGPVCAALQGEPAGAAIAWARDSVWRLPTDQVAALLDYDRVLVEVYCPDRSAVFEEFVAGLRTG